MNKSLVGHLRHQHENHRLPAEQVRARVDQARTEETAPVTCRTVQDDVINSITMTDSRGQPSPNNTFYVQKM